MPQLFRTPFRTPFRTAPADAGRTVYRPVLSRVMLGVFAAIGVWWAADLALRGRPGEAVLLALWLAAVVAALACLFWRPAVVVDDAGVELRNVVRDVRVPWPALDDVTTRYTLTLHAGGRRHQSWAGPAPGRGTAPGRGAAGGRLPDDRWNPGGANPASSSRDLRADSGATAFLVEQGWRSWRDRRGSQPDGEDSARVEVSWRPVLPAVAAGTAVLAAALTPFLR